MKKDIIVRCLNTKANRVHLKGIGQPFTVDGRYLLIKPYWIQAQSIRMGKLSIRAYKERILGL